jgi:competence ComEA-like helix-hairpin-helix protein
MLRAFTRPVAGANWAWLSLIPFGLGSWAPLYAGTRVRNLRWCAWGAVWSAITLAGWTLAVVMNGGAFAGLLIILGWTGAIATSFSIAAGHDELASGPSVRGHVGSGWSAALRDAEERLRERDRARRLAVESPELALEMGVGRPDLAGAIPTGLVDINNAPAAALAALPGVGMTRAEAIVKAREEIRGFSSVEDLGLALNFDGALVERLRGRVVFLPR